MILSKKQLEEIHEAQQLIEAKRGALGIQISPDNALLGKLKSARRLSAPTVEVFDIQPYKYGYQWGWKYPVITGGERWKNANSDAQPKYAWIPSKPDNATLYHAPDLLPAIAEAGGLVWYTTEADVWTLREAGINNAFSTFAESIVPDELGDVLLSMGVNRVMIAPDLDQAGDGWAQRIKAALWGSTTELTCYQLPAQLGKAGDIGKAWQDYRQPDPFGFWLMNLPQVEVIAPTPTHTTPTPVYFGIDPLAEIKTKITSLLGVEKFGTDNFSLKNIRCIFHDDKRPSASLHKDKGLYCHSCVKAYTWKELADRLGVDWTFSTTTIAALPIGIVGMSREARAAMIAEGATNEARAFDVLIDLDRAGEDYTLKELQAVLLPHITKATTRAIFERLQGKKIPKQEDGSFCCVFSFLITLQHEEGKKVSKNSKRGRAEGRPQGTVRTPTAAQLTQAVGVTASHYYAMPADVISNAKLYRAACMADVIRRKPGKHARKQLADPLGISYPTIKTYCDAAGIVRTPQPPKKTELTPAQVIALPADHNALKLMIAHKKIKSNVFLEDESGGRHEYTQAGAKQAAAMGGGKLYRMEWQASDYRPQGIV
jgi:hypothetical protein